MDGINDNIKLAIIAVVVLGCFFSCLIVAGIGFFFSSSSFTQPKDLGVQYSSNDSSIGLERISKALASSGNGSNYSASTYELKSYLTQEEVSAMLASFFSENQTLKDAQIQFNPDGTFELSGLLQDPRLTAPIYARGTIELVSERQLEISITDLKAMGIGVPDSQLKDVEQSINSGLADVFTENPELSLSSLKIQDGKVIFKATFPKDLKGVEIPGQPT